MLKTMSAAICSSTPGRSAPVVARSRTNKRILAARRSLIWRQILRVAQNPAGFFKATLAKTRGDRAFFLILAAIFLRLRIKHGQEAIHQVYVSVGFEALRHAANALPDVT
jgi:hypothetical protein